MYLSRYNALTNLFPQTSVIFQTENLKKKKYCRKLMELGHPGKIEVLINAIKGKLKILGWKILIQEAVILRIYNHF